MAGGDLARHKRTAADLGAWLVFEDESGQGLRPPKGRTWGRRGQTPVVTVTGGHDTRVSLAALIATRPGCQPRLIYRTHHVRRADKRKGFTEPDYARLLDAAHQQLGGPLVLVWDNLNTHTSRVMRDLISARAWLTVYQLPSYASELNPVECLRCEQEVAPRLGHIRRGWGGCLACGVIDGGLNNAPGPTSRRRNCGWADSRGQLLLREVKTETSQAPLPLPGLCVTALKIRKQQQDADRARAGRAWIETGLVFTTRHGTPIEPGNFNRSFTRCIAAAKVPAITVHGTRKTCGSLLAALDVHSRFAMQILRHSKIAVTMEIYTEIPSAATRAALHKLGQWLGN